jgi:hypothetical protein
MGSKSSSLRCLCACLNQTASLRTHKSNPIIRALLTHLAPCMEVDLDAMKEQNQYLKSREKELDAKIEEVGKDVYNQLDSANKSNWSIMYILHILYYYLLLAFLIIDITDFLHALLHFSLNLLHSLYMQLLYLYFSLINRVQQSHHCAIDMVKLIH